MERRDFLAASMLGAVSAKLGLEEGPSTPPIPHYAGRKILIAGGNYNTTWIKMMAQLTGKPRPRICYLPTASADSPAGSISFFKACAPLNVEPFVQNSFIESLTQKQGWDEVLLSMD